jgi:hypothetical protein
MQSSHPNIFSIEFEEDIDTLRQFDDQLDVEPPLSYRSRSLSSRSRSRDTEKHPQQPDHVVTEMEISYSFLSAVLSTIQPLDEHRSLLVLRVTCHPAPGRRFKNSTITWRFAPAAPSSTEQPSPIFSTKLVALAPQHSVGGWTEEQTTLIWGLKVKAGGGFVGGSAGVDPSVEKETQKAVLHAMTILGSIRSNGRACWTVEENKSSERGIPTHFQLAVVLDHGGVPFVTELEVKAELGGGLWPHNFVQGKKGQDLRKVIDVNTWKCGEVEWESGEAGWKKFMAGMTGEVSGAIVEFEQSIVRP